MANKITIRFAPERGAKVTILNDPNGWEGNAQILRWDDSGMAFLRLEGFQCGAGEKRQYTPICAALAFGEYRTLGKEVEISFDDWTFITPWKVNTDIPALEGSSV